MNSSLLVIGTDTLLGKHIVRAAAEQAGDGSVFAFARKDLPLDDLPNLIVDLESSKPTHLVLVHETDMNIEPMFECADRAHDQLTAILNIYAAAAHLGCRRISIVASHVTLDWRDITALSAENFLRSTPSFNAPPATLVSRMMLTQNHYYLHQYRIETYFYIYPYIFGDYASQSADPSERLNLMVDAVVQARHNGEGRLALAESSNWEVDLAYAGDVARAVLSHAESGRTGVAVHPPGRPLTVGGFAQAVARAADYAGEIAHGTEQPLSGLRLSTTEAKASGNKPTDLDTGLRVALARRTHGPS
jgi:nucleoside-diphosphate-sugar epimerase